MASAKSNSHEPRVYHPVYALLQDEMPVSKIRSKLNTPKILHKSHGPIVIKPWKLIISTVTHPTLQTPQTSDVNIAPALRTVTDNFSTLRF